LTLGACHSNYKMSSKTPKNTGKPTTTPKSQQPASHSHSHNHKSGNKQQPQQQAVKTPVANKPKEIPQKSRPQEDDDDDDDEDDEEEQHVLGGAAKKANKADPEDEDEMNGVHGEEEDAEEEDDEDFDGSAIFDVVDHLANGNQVCIRVPAGMAIQVIGASTEERDFPLHITNACLGPVAAADDRATLVATMFVNGGASMEEDEEEEEEEEEEKGEDDDEQVEEIVCGTLCRGTAENVALDVVLEGNFILSNTSKETDIYVTARVIMGGSDEDDDDADYEEFGEEEEEDEEEEEEEEDPSEVKAKALEMRKRLLAGSENVAKDSKKVKVSGEPKVLDVKAAGKPTPAVGSAGSKVTAEAVKNFILKEVKAKKTIKLTDLGTLITKEFGKAFKQLGLEEKSVTPFLEKHGGGKVKMTATDVIYIQ